MKHKVQIEWANYCSFLKTENPNIIPGHILGNLG